MKYKNISGAVRSTKVPSHTVKAALLLLLIAFQFQTFAQATYSLDVDPELKVSGTSTIHDWEMTANSASGMAKITIENDRLINISFLEITMLARSLKSGKGAMDTNAYKALKADRHPSIFFELIEVEKIANKQVTAKGKLTLSGASRVVILDVNYEINSDQLWFSGKHNIKFSEFNIDPPTAVFGTIKTGDDLTLSFNVIFKSTTKITKQ